jgi:hypothetical protein
LAIVVCTVLTAGVSTAGEGQRTPGEIKARRAEIEQRLVVLAEDQARLIVALANVEQKIAETPAKASDTLAEERARIRSRLEEVATERDALTNEVAELDDIPTRTATGPIGQADPGGLVPLQVAGTTGQSSPGNAFNPAITLIPDGLYYNDNRGGDVGDILIGADGFGASGAEVETDSPPRGFSLRDVELSFSGSVDPYFDVWATFGIADGEVDGEEIFVQTRRLLPGVQIRLGKFFSGIGYINRQHRHQWDFVDQALPYEALFGPRVGETGVQVTWLPALPVYIQLGFETLQGSNPLMSNQLVEQYPGLFEETPGPRLFNGFLKVSPDFGYSNTLQAGVSFGRSRSHQEAEQAPGIGIEAFDGATWFLVTDWVWRYDSSRQYGQGDLTVQGEYIYRSKSLDLVRTTNRTNARSSQQDGLYAQVVYGVGPRWTIGGRFEVIGLRNRIETLTQPLDLSASTRSSANVTFNPTEFSRFRVQYNHGSFLSGQKVHFDQLYVQFQMSLGVHGAHRF